MRSNDCFVCKMVRMYWLVAAPSLLVKRVSTCDDVLLFFAESDFG